MVTRARNLLLYTDTSDTEVRTGRKWKAQETADQAKSWLLHSDLEGAVTCGWTGLESNPTASFNKAPADPRGDLSSGWRKPTTGQ